MARRREAANAGLGLEAAAMGAAATAGAGEGSFDEVLLLFVDENVGVGSLGEANAWVCGWGEVGARDAVEFIEYLLVVEVCLGEAGVGTGFRVHDGAPAWSLKVVETDFGVCG